MSTPTPCATGCAESASSPASTHSASQARSICSRSRGCRNPHLVDSAVAIPGPQIGLGVHRAAADVDLEVEVAADRPSVTGLPDVAHDLTDVNQVSLLECRRVSHVGIPVLAPLSESAEHDEVAVEARVVRALDDRPGDSRREGRPAARDDVEALVDSAAVPWSADPPTRAPGPVGAAHRIEVAVQLDAAGLLGIPTRDGDDHAVGPVGDQAPAVRQPVPPDGLVVARL